MQWAPRPWRWYRNEPPFPEAQSPGTDNGLEKGSLRKPGPLYRVRGGKVSGTVNLHLPLLRGTHERGILAKETKEPSSGFWFGFFLVFLLKGTDTFSRRHSDSCDIGSLVSY